MSEPDAKQLAQLTWGSSPTGWAVAKEFLPGTKEFFDKSLMARRTHEMVWLPEAIPFDQAKGKKVLEIGFGPGFDALSFCEQGAKYEGIDLTPENVERAAKHLSFYGYAPTFRQGDAENLPYGKAAFDVVFSNGVLHHVPDIDRALQEAHRVLVPGGMAFVILYNKNSLFYRVTLSVFHHILLGGWRKQTLAERLSAIEANEAGHKPLVRVYSQRDCQRLFAAAGFDSVRTSVWKLTWEDLPAHPLMFPLLKRIPEKWLGKLGRLVGWYVVVSGRKPR